ncbi:probable tRNA methyltransferase 9B isoform X1 [Latimeria chalumnae]|uniref:probable tRNA methyltransferase 9B isoform X1 n=1 Tax=Latimeria chalumnae TaxID=7897 RepID=UPI0003C192BB|nr:PREDICTED: probable tRNA methyltransferase 9-like protein isoform X2 [Latimeria chalumnae]|eukprot:XP_006009444.1 PREDICTED: probable tRNA methyltransferase 9-like protein isoform X2 [Latimeria chalumnae]
MEKEASRLERDHVHSVYEKIAPYFSDTRYKAWPRVRQFLLDQEPGSLIADIVIHHFSTKERRIRAIREMARTLRVGGQLMICVWAMEQKKRKFEKQDVFVPWNLTPPSPNLFVERHVLTTSRKFEGKPKVLPNHLMNSNASMHESHRKTKSTSSVGEDDAVYASFEKSLRMWLFSQSLDSVLDFGHNNHRRSQKEFSMLCGYDEQLREKSRPKLSEQNETSSSMKQVSSLLSNRKSSGDNVFRVSSGMKSPSPHSYDVCSKLCENNRLGSVSSPAQSATIVHGCSKVSLPDLVDHSKECIEEKEPLYHNSPRSGLDFCKLKNKSPSTCMPLQDTDMKCGRSTLGNQELENPNGACLRYYHVFREGELAELIEKHVFELHVLQIYLDHANWCLIAEKVQVWKI